MILCQKFPNGENFGYCAILLYVVRGSNVESPARFVLFKLSEKFSFFENRKITFLKVRLKPENILLR